jgi:hypothetical protein
VSLVCKGPYCFGIPKTAVFKKDLSTDESLSVLRILLAVTKPVKHTPELYNLLGNN